MLSKNWNSLNKSILNCRKCKRLVNFREKIARNKTKRYNDWKYWGKPVLGYGDRQGELIILGLAPAAHGGNRTGRVFTGDKSADFLIDCLHKSKITNKPLIFKENIFLSDDKGTIFKITEKLMQKPCNKKQIL